MQHFLIILLYLLAMGCTQPGPAEDNTKEAPDVYKQNALLRRGINLGNALEAPDEGEWGVVIKESYFELIKEKGFQAVRIPIRWSAHARIDSPYSIDNAFFNRVDWIIAKARLHDLAVVINIHHYEEIMQAPEEHEQRLLAMWRQISHRYKDHSSMVLFEILNEPNHNLTPRRWNGMLIKAIEQIREVKPDRTLIVGTAEWGGLGALSQLTLPEDDRNIIVTFHYYEPFQFTHQGAEWVDGSASWLGTTWTGSEEEKKAVREDLDAAATWANQNDRPLFMGEFGAYSRADMDSRVRWTNYLARQAEQRNISWAYWEFCSGFGIYEDESEQWKTDLLYALIPNE